MIEPETPTAPPTSPAPVRPTSREVALDAEGRVDEDLACRGCGYNLRGISTEALCPECALPVGRSVLGDLLQCSDPAWVRRLSRGTRWLIAGLLAAIVVPLGVGILVFVLMASATAGAGPGLFVGVGGLVIAAMAFVVVFGVWQLTSPDPGRLETEGTLSTRRLARWCILCMIVSAPLELASESGITMAFASTGTAWVTALTILPIVAGAFAVVTLIGQWALLLHLSRLALRIPSKSLSSQAKIVMWGYGVSRAFALVVALVTALAMPAMIAQLGAAAPPPGAGGAPPPAAAGPTPAVMTGMIVAGIGGCVASLGLLVFGVWAIVILFLFAGAFGRASLSAAALWTTTPTADETGSE